MIQASFPAVLVLAALGQGLMAQNCMPATIFPALVFYVLALLLWWVVALQAEKAELLKGEPLPARLEWMLFGLIFLLAAFLRVYKLNEIPSGIFLDASGPAVMALKMDHENWKPPFFMMPQFANPTYVLYLLAFWFRWVAPTQANLFLFYVFFALASLPLVYWTFRQLTGPRTALLTLYFIAVMRWHMVFSRIGFRGIQVPFYMFGTLAFFLYGLRQKKGWPFLISAFFLAGGLYTYQAFKALPLLMAILLVYEYRQNPKALKALVWPLLTSTALCFILAVPLLRYWTQQGSLGTRESQIFIGKEVVQEKSLRPLVRKAIQTVLMFNRKGEEQPRHNYKDHPLLDDVTGLFFVLGFAFAFWKWKQRPYFYAVCGFLVMSLPGVLSSEETQSHRMLGALPFVAFFAATAVLAWQKGMAGRFPSARSWINGLVACLLIFAAAENIKTYFVDQAGDYDCWRDFNIEASTVGKTIVENPDTAYYLAPAFYQHFTVQYLDYFESNRVHLLDLGGMNHQPLDNHLSKICFVLDEGKSPTLDFLKKLYPGGREEPFKDRKGETLAFFYYIPSPVQPLLFRDGLERRLEGSQGSHWDPLINITSIGDLGVSHPPLQAVWKGKIQVPTTGSYGFLILTHDEGELDLDGRKVVNTLQGGEGLVWLKAGWHFIELTCRRESNPDVELDFHFLWKKPGEKQYEVVPNPAFGKIL